MKNQEKTDYEKLIAIRKEITNLEEELSLLKIQEKEAGKKALRFALYFLLFIGALILGLYI